MSGWYVAAAALFSGVAVVGAWPASPRRDELMSAVGAGASSAPPEVARGSTDLLRLRAPLSLVAGMGAALAVGGWLGAVLGIAVSRVAWRALGRMEPADARRRRESLVALLPQAVDLMASALAVGASPDAAVRVVAEAVDEPMRHELGRIQHRLSLGVDPVRVWSEVGRHPELGALGRCLARALESGASVSDALHRLAEDLRRSARAEVEARARTVGIRAAAPLGLCLLPAFILTGIVPLVAGTVSVLFR